jgi:hypothetical protein
LESVGGGYLIAAQRAAPALTAFVLDVVLVDIKGIVPPQLAPELSAGWFIATPPRQGHVRVNCED